MLAIGRMTKEDNDLFYLCSLIEYIARKTKNMNSDVVNALGKERIKKIYDLADIYHFDHIDCVSDEFIEEAQISFGNYDNVAACRYAIPSYWDIGKVYKRLIKMAASKDGDVIEAVMNVYQSFICEKINDYNSSMYYENPSYIYACYEEGEVL